MTIKVVDHAKADNVAMYARIILILIIVLLIALGIVMNISNRAHKTLAEVIALRHQLAKEYERGFKEGCWFIANKEHQTKIIYVEKNNGIRSEDSLRIRQRLQKQKV